MEALVGAGIGSRHSRKRAAAEPATAGNRAVRCLVLDRTGDDWLGLPGCRRRVPTELVCMGMDKVRVEDLAPLRAALPWAHRQNGPCWPLFC